MYCGRCKQECGVLEYDDSFSHEFGVEKRHHYGSDCCDAEVYEERCQACIENLECPICEGIGLIGKVEIDSLEEVEI